MPEVREAAAQVPQTMATGTLAWVGPVDRVECAEPFRYCAQRAPQIAHRHSIEHLLERPAQGVGRIVVVRLDRQPPPRAIGMLVRRFPTAQRSLLLGSACEGESRSGFPWPRFEAFYWHRWNQVLPAWFADQPSASTSVPTGSSRRPKRRAVGIIASHRGHLDALAEGIASRGHTVLWAPQDSTAMAGLALANLDVCLWDDSAAPATSAARWQARLAPITRTGGTPQRIRHLWLVGFPRPADWAAAAQAGVHGMISKPFAAPTLLDAVGQAIAGTA